MESLIYRARGTDGVGWGCCWRGRVLIVAFLLGACAESRPDAFDQQLEVEGPLTVSGRFLYVHRTFDRLFFLTPSYRGDDVDVRVDGVAVGDRPLAPTITPDGQRVLVINGGDQTLSVVDVAELTEQRLELPSDYDALVVSPDGRFVVAYFADAQSGGSGDAVFRNQNEITIFDFDPDGTGAPGPAEQVDVRVLSLRSSPLGFDFAPTFTLNGITHRLLVVRATSALTLVDLTATNEDDVQRRVFFVPENSSRRLIPTRLIFTADDPEDERDMRLFVLTTDPSDPGNIPQDVFEVSILPDPESDERLALSLNQFPAGPKPVEMLSWFDPEAAQKLLVLSGQARILVVVDVDTGNTVELDIDWFVNRALPYTLANEETGQIEQWALLYQTGSPTVVFANLDQLESRGTRALTSLVLSRPIDSADLAPGGEQAIAVHTGSTALSVINLRQQFDIPLPGSATLRNTAFSVDGQWLYTTVAERSVLVRIELANAHPEEIDMPTPGDGLALLADPQVILIDHGQPEGRITALNGVEPDLEGATEVGGLFLAGAMDRARDGIGAGE